MVTPLVRLWFPPFARESALAFALSGVAEGFVERAVRALGRVCKHAVDDKLHLVERDFVCNVARSDGLQALFFQIV